MCAMIMAAVGSEQGLFSTERGVSDCFVSPIVHTSSMAILSVSVCPCLCLSSLWSVCLSLGSLSVSLTRKKSAKNWAQAKKVMSNCKMHHSMIPVEEYQFLLELIISQTKQVYSFVNRGTKTLRHGKRIVIGVIECDGNPLFFSNHINNWPRAQCVLRLLLKNRLIVILDQSSGITYSCQIFKLVHRINIVIGRLCFPNPQGGDPFHVLYMLNSSTVSKNRFQSCIRIEPISDWENTKKICSKISSFLCCSKMKNGSFL